MTQELDDFMQKYAENESDILLSDWLRNRHVHLLQLLVCNNILFLTHSINCTFCIYSDKCKSDSKVSIGPSVETRIRC